TAVLLACLAATALNVAFAYPGTVSGGGLAPTTVTADPTTPTTDPTADPATTDPASYPGTITGGGL
ncbi:MAG TPA: hypothetical protein VHN99_10805, partial [Deinococcales bacterium]|nr:hypothetical protein [Deinococcales bacterium]